MSEAERIDLPSGESLWYVDADHSYWRHNPETGKKGKRLTGVTTACKPCDFNPDGLLRWAARTQLIGVAELAEPLTSDHGADLGWLTSQEGIQSALEDAELTFEHIRDRAAKRGSNVHEIALQALALGRSVPDLDSLTEEERGYAQAVMSFWLEEEPEVEQVEQIVYSERLGVAGRLDLRCSIASRDGIGVLDAKTGRYISAAAHTQVGGGYPLLAEESGFGSSEWALILKLSEDGTYELIEAQAEPEDFEAAVDMYRRSARINREAGKARKLVAA